MCHIQSIIASTFSSMLRLNLALTEKNNGHFDAARRVFQDGTRFEPCSHVFGVAAIEAEGQPVGLISGPRTNAEGARCAY